MADLKISQLTPGAPALLTDVFPIERGATANFSLTVGNIINLIPSQTFTNLTTNTLVLNSNITGYNGVGSSGQILASRGSGFSPTWIDSFPVGGIIMWSGSIANKPTGWFLCNGLNGTPDLRNRFIIGASQDVNGIANTTVTGSSTVTGGSKDSIVVSHNHGITEPNAGAGHDHTLNNSNYGVNKTLAVYTGTDLSGGFSGGNNHWFSTATTIAKSTTDITINYEGNSGTNQNLPPYYALAFIMRGPY